MMAKQELGQPRTTPWWEVLLCYGVLAAFALIYTFGYLKYEDRSVPIVKKKRVIRYR
jgi:hypothetical protein